MTWMVTHPEKEQDRDQAQQVNGLLQGQLSGFGPNAVVMLQRILLEELHDGVSEARSLAKGVSPSRR